MAVARNAGFKTLSQSNMRKTIPIILAAVTLGAGFQMCLGDGPPLSITTSNQNVILTWPRADTNWVLVETGGLDTYFESNGVLHIEAKKIISSNNYGTNGTNFFIVLPVDPSGNRFYMLLTNNFPTPPTP
jgi:hypothetical protein